MNKYFCTKVNDMSTKPIHESPRMVGHVTIELFKPGTQELVEREEGYNVICKAAADAIATAIATGVSPGTYPYMVISTGTTAVARATTAIEETRYISSSITPTVVNGASTSVITWVYTFTAGAGKSAIAKFGLESATPSGGNLLNEYLFNAVKDNLNNDLKITYNLSIAP